MNEPSVDLLQKYRAGDEQAAEELFRRYVSRLTVLARARMAPRIARRIDPEDVVLSTFRSFFVRARNGRFSLARSGDLWKLLVGIMFNKLHRQIAHHSSAKRDIRREQPLPEGGDSAWEAPLLSGHAPAPEEALAIAEVLESVLAELEPAQRQVVEMRLLDHTLEEIAALTNRSERTVRRTLADLSRRLRERLSETSDGSATRADHSRRPEPSALDMDVDSRPPHLNSTPMAPGSAPAAESRPGHGASHWDRDFVLQLHLGSGGMGKVYRALERSSGQLVAVKMLRKRLQGDPVAIARFLNEARAAMPLKHPGIVGVRGIGRTRAGGYFLVQDFVAGQSLAEIAAARRIEIAEAARWLTAAGEAVDHAHRQGVIHCDLKPANLLLDCAGTVHVTDFGLAQMVTAGSGRCSAIAGTVGYMAPEQLDQGWGAIDARTDVFGLGAVLFSILAGRAPFGGRTIDEILQNVLEGPPSVVLARPDAGALDPICRKCLAPAPGERFSTAAAVAQAIREAQAGA